MLSRGPHGALVHAQEYGDYSTPMVRQPVLVPGSAAHRVRAGHALHTRATLDPAALLMQGRGDACLSAPESYRLNWATAVASLDATSLEVAQQSTFQVPALHSTPTNVVLVKTTVSGAKGQHRSCISVTADLQCAADALDVSLAPRQCPAQWLTPYDKNLYFSLRVKVSPL